MCAVPCYFNLLVHTVMLSNLQEIARREKELEATIRRPAEAEKYKTEKLAQANRFVLLFFCFSICFECACQDF